jgi:hypothetical protein
LGWWLGVAHDVGGPICFWVLPKSCKVIARTTVHSLTADEMADPAVRVQISELDSAIHSKIGDTIADTDMDPDLQGLLPHVPDDLFLDVDDDDQEFIEPEVEMPEADDLTPEQYDEYLNAEFLLPRPEWGHHQGSSGGKETGCEW